MPARSHGETGTKRTRLYVCWQNMNRFGHHRGRAWAKYETFKGWALANGYRPGLVLIRIDRGGDFTPENCCWLPAERHGGWRTRLYRIWGNMINRCRVGTYYKPYHNGRGIKVCVEWFSFVVFRRWAKRSGYADHLELDRIDPDGDYCETNCRWASHSQQGANQRKQIGTSSKFKGVWWSKRAGKWQVGIENYRRKYYLGYFIDEDDAGRAYDRAARRLFGRYARLNFGK